MKFERKYFGDIVDHNGSLFLLDKFIRARAVQMLYDKSHILLIDDDERILTLLNIFLIYFYH